jgi:hypothetical protein
MIRRFVAEMDADGGGVDVDVDLKCSFCSYYW